MLRHNFPELGTIADEVIELEDESGIWLRWIENDLVRLVTIIKLAEDREDCIDIYSKALDQLKVGYSNWLQNETKWHVTSEQQIVIEMMNRLYEHLEDKNVPISTYAEIKDKLNNYKKI